MAIVPTTDYAKEQVTKLDEWAAGFLFGTAFGAFMLMGLAWAVMEPLK